MPSKTLLASVVIAALAIATPALGQSEPQDQPSSQWPGRNMMMWGGGGPNGYGPGMMGFGMMRGCPMMAGSMMGAASDSDYQRSASAWLDGQLAYIHSELAITPAQEPAWDVYAAAIKARSGQMLSTHQTMMSAMWQDKLPFDQAYDLHIQAMESHLDAMKTTRDAALKLFHALTPDQQEKASWVLPQSMCMM
ncbi:Spy/CpxP family protein refolding chaperone [Dongia sp.]|uniref:Spy/CpxP family protein refolding chaperone n=1 Tax=Dongia sp. TaxID=1977262 RepID=UPI0037528BE2